MASIEKRTNLKGTTYRVKVRLKGQPPQTATFERKTDAKKWAQITEAAIKEGRHFKTTEAKKRTVAEMLEKYKKEVIPHKKSQQPATQVLEWWKKEIGHYTLADVSTSFIKDYKDKLLNEPKPSGKKKSPSTINRYLALLSHAFSVAVKEWEWVDKNPVLNVSKFKEPSGRVRFLDEHERVRLLTACQQSSNKDLYPIVVLAISTGMRLGEIMSLCWKNIDLEANQATLLDTKNGDARSVPIVGLSRELLIARSAVRRIDTNLIFPSSSKPQQPVDIRKAWNTALEKAEIENFKFHDLRHTAASYLAMNGASLLELADILGHKTLQMVKRYAHLSPNHKISIVEKMNKSIF